MSALVCPCRHGSHDDIFNVSERSRSEPLVQHHRVTKTAEPRRMPGKSAPGRACLRDPASLSRPPARASHALSRRARPPPGHSAGAHLPTHACSALIRVCCACRLPTLDVHWWEYLLQYFQNRKYCKYCFEHSQYLQYFHLQIPGICSENRVFAQHLLRNGRTACGLLSFPSFFTQGRSTGSPLALAPSPSSHTRMTKPHAQPRLPERAPHDDSRAAACTCATYLSEKASGHGGPAG